MIKHILQTLLAIWFSFSIVFLLAAVMFSMTNTPSRIETVLSGVWAGLGEVTFISKPSRLIYIQTTVDPFLDRFRGEGRVTFESVSRAIANDTQDEKNHLTGRAFQLFVALWSHLDVDPGLIWLGNTVPKRLLELRMVYLVTEYQSDCLLIYEGYPMPHLV